MLNLFKNLHEPVTPETSIYAMIFVGAVFAIFGLVIILSDYLEDRKASQESN